VIHQLGERPSRRPGRTRSENHVLLPRMPSPQLGQRAVK